MMRPSQIKPRHLERLAIGYGRQSTAVQVEKHTGSSEYQRGQLRFPIEWGWAPERVRWLDDFGLTGTAAEHRPGYRQLRVMIRKDAIGIACVSDHSRLGRNAAEWLAFVADCLAHDVLIAIDGKIVDLGDTNDRLHTSLMAVLAEHDGLNRRDTLQRGRLAKLMGGKAVSAPPVGYLPDQKGRWALDPDPMVRGAIAAVFREFFRGRSLRATVIRLREQAIKIPRRKPGHPVRWREASIPILKDIFSNPNYTPDYFYRRRVDDHRKGRSAKGRYRIRRASADEMHVIPDHHVGYLTHDQWQEIRAIFRSNAWSADHANLGVGPALVQGLPRCTRHRSRILLTHYKRGRDAGPRCHSYRCRGDYDLGGAGCRSIPGGALDDAIATLVLDRLSPPTIAAVKAAFDRAMADSRADQRHREIEKTHLHHRIADLEEKLDILDANSFDAFKAVERRYEQAKRELAALEEGDLTKRQHAVQNDAATLEEAEKLAREVRKTWEASTTTAGDRKSLVRIVIRTILVEDWDKERLRVRIKWVDGWPESVVDVLLPAGVKRLILELQQQGKSFEETAQRLSAMGIRTRRGKQWTRKIVQQFVWRVRRQSIVDHVGR
jgi:DNA invertase Pin-like site-specific DNA recombinase